MRRPHKTLRLASERGRRDVLKDLRAIRALIGMALSRGSLLAACTLAVCGENAWPANAVSMQDAYHFSVIPTVTSAPSVKFDWATQPAGSSVEIYRRVLAATGGSGGTGGLASFSLRATVAASAKTFSDTGVAAGTQYEYYFRRINSGYGFDYEFRLVVTVGSALEDVRGSVLLVVDETMSAPLAAELRQYEMDLVGDGWNVIRMDSPRHSDAEPGRATVLRNAIKSVAAANPTLNSVILFGKLPVVYSGWDSPDGHENRTFATDAYYADLDGAWTDTATQNSGGLVNDPGNLPGDGIFDQHNMPSAAEVAVGRVDFSNMTKFRKFEVEYLRDYINKSHAWRHGHRTAAARVLQNDPWDVYMYGDTNFFRSAFSSTAVDNETNLQPAASLNAYLWAFGYDLYNSTMQGLPVKAVFTGLFKSYMMEWQRPDASMRCYMTQPDWGLTACWQSWFWHHLLAGRPFGDAIRYQWNWSHGDANVTSSSGWWGGEYGSNAVWMNFMGDPTLRMHVVAPPSAASVGKTGATATITWAPSTAPNLAGYHVYRSSNRLTGYTRLTATPVVGTSFVDNAAPAGAVYYQVRAVATTTVTTGFYTNQSQAAWAVWKSNDSANTLPVADAGSFTAKSNSPVRFTFGGSDPDGDVLTPIIITNPAHGQLRWDRGQSFYISSPDYTGADSFVFVMSDGAAVSAPATVTVTVSPADDVLLAWELPDTATTSTPGQASTYAAPHIQAGALTIGAGVVAASPGTKIDQFAVRGCASPAFDSDDYIAWTVAPDAAYQISLKRVTFGAFVDAEGVVANVELRASVDNFASSSVVVPLHRTTVTGGAAGAGILTGDLSDPALQNVAGPIQFRLYVWNASGMTASTAFGVGKLTDDAGSGVPDAIEDLVVQGMVISANAEASVARGGIAVSDGGTDGGLEFLPGVPHVLTYTISNLGSQALSVATPTIASPPANGTAVVSSVPATSVDPVSGTTSFNVTVTPAAKAAVSFVISIPSGDPLRNPYNWTVSGAADYRPAVAVPVPDAQVLPGRAFSYQFPPGTFTDQDGDALVYTATKSDGSALPAWLAFNAETRTFSGTPRIADAGAVVVRLTADDGFGGRGTEEFTITVETVDYFVTTTADSGAGSLRQAIIDSNAAAAAADSAVGRRILFAVPGNAGTITMGSDFPALTKSMTIDGGGAAITIDGGVAKSFRPFACATASVNLTLKNLTLDRCGRTETAANARGGAIQWLGTGILTLENVTIQNCLIKAAPSASTSYYAAGGGIAAAAGTLNLTDVTISGCTAQIVTGTTTASYSYGGGLYTNGPVTVNMTRCSVRNNTLVTNAGALTSAAAGYGGGICFYGPTALLTLTGCSIVGNTSTQNGGGIAYYSVSGAADGSARLLLSRCTVSGNTASGAAKSSGGGIYTTVSAGKYANLTLYASTVAGNTVSHPTSTAQGGGIFAYNGGTSMLTEIYNSTISANTATATTAANGSGGGIYLFNILDNKLAVISSIVQGNTMSATGSATVGADITKGTNAAMFGTPSRNIVGSTNGAHGMSNGVNACVIGSALLNPLADNGGPTQTMSLQANSPAISSGSMGWASTAGFDVTTDQRGTGYLRDSSPDIGAFEIQTSPPVIGIQPANTSVLYGASAALAVVATGSGLSYQWYLGASGNTSNPIPSAITSSYTTPVLTSSAVYWVRVTNLGGSVDSASASVSVATAFDTWASGIADPARRGAGDDPDADGISNLMEFALGLASDLHGYGSHLSGDVIGVGGSDHLAITYTCPEPAPSGVTYAVKVSSDLVAWTAAQTVEVGNTVDAGFRTITVRDTEAVGGANPKRFIRLEVSSP